MRKVMREHARLDLERRVRWYRKARQQPRPPEGWLRAMRLAVGIRAEENRNISLERLERMARAVGCDLVYGLVPWERSLEDRAMELVEREVWRKRYTTRRVGKAAV